MMKKVFSLIVVIMLVSAVSQATVIEDFEGFAVDDSLSGQTGWNVENGSFTVAADPLDAGNKVMSLYQGNSIAYLEIPTIPETDSSTTVSFRVMWGYDTIKDNDQVIGLADVMITPDDWNNMGPIVRTQDGTIDYRDGGDYVDTLIPTVYDVWHDFELVLDNVNETYDIIIDGIEEVTGAAYRNQGTVGDLVYMVFRSASGLGDTGPMYIDDITFGPAGFDFVPDPEHGETVPVDDPLALSWLYLPDCNDLSDTASVVVYWDTEPNGVGGTQTLTPTALTVQTVDVAGDLEIGTYYWKIVATDPDFEGSGTSGVLAEAVYSLITIDGCDAAKIGLPYSPTDARLVGDTNYDCKVNLADFAVMASNWLTVVSK